VSLCVFSFTGITAGLHRHFDNLTVDTKVHQHISLPGSRRRDLSWQNLLFFFFIDVSLPLQKKAAKRLYTPCFLSLSTGIQPLRDVRDVEQRKIHTPFPLAGYLVALSSSGAAFGTLCCSSGRFH
jgi:hypothetical protein